MIQCNAGHALIAFKQVVYWLKNQPMTAVQNHMNGVSAKFSVTFQMDVLHGEQIKESQFLFFIFFYFFIFYIRRNNNLLLARF